MSQIAIVDTIRTLAFGGISGAYAVVGTPTTNATRLICFTNNTNGDVFFSNNGINNQFFVPAGSFKLLDITSNRDDMNGFYAFPSSMQWYVKQSTAPSSGAVYIEVLYGMPS